MANLTVAQTAESLVGQKVVPTAGWLVVHWAALKAVTTVVKWAVVKVGRKAAEKVEHWAHR